MEQQTLIILAIVFVAIIAAMQPAVCDCTSEGAASAPVMSAYLRAVKGGKSGRSVRTKAAKKKLSA
jgi:hypothetical protein